MEKYNIHENYQEQFNQEESKEIIEERDTKEKRKEIKKSPIKIELEKGEEYTTGTVEDFKDYLERRYGKTEDIDLEDFIKNMGMESTIDEIDREREIEKEKLEMDDLLK